jgi:hypothetical protein
MAAMAQEVKSGTVTDIRKSFDRRAVAGSTGCDGSRSKNNQDASETVVVAT